MTQSPAPDPVAAAREYDEGLVPALMQEWAPRLVAAATIRPGDRVLDVACGTGVLTRMVAETVTPSGTVIGLDIDPGMLAVARARRSDLQWQEGSADQLPYPDASFDAVVSQFGLMFFPSPPRALAEMWRVLKPGGRMAVAVWASLEETPAYEAETRMIERIAGPVASEPLRLPFRMGERALFEAQFAAAAIPLEAVTTIVGEGRFPSLRAMVAADVVGWLRVMGVHLPDATLDAIFRDTESVLAPYRQPDGSARFASPAHLAVARRP